MPRNAPATSAITQSAEQAEPEAQVQIGGAEPDRIGAEAEEGRLREIDLAAQAEHDGKPEHGDRIGRRLHQDVQDVAVEAACAAASATTIAAPTKYGRCRRAGCAR